MPVEVRGALELKKALRNYTPDLAKQMTKEIGDALKPVVRQAHAFVPSTAPLSGWGSTGFWGFNARAIHKGLGYKTTPSRPNPQGFRSLAQINNKSSIGAIIETAGRKSPDGQPWVGPNGPASKKTSHSNNPKAGKQFIEALGALYGSREGTGRIIYRAWKDNSGAAQDGVLRAIEKASAQFKARTEKVK